MSIPRSAPFWCSRCGTSFRRSEHLERHILSHGSERPYQCLFCQQGFKRRDVLKRHWRACKSRLEQDREIPHLAPKTKGKKRKACDRCVRLKKACSQGYPCDSCRGKEGVCTIDGVVQGVESNEDEGDTVVAPDGDGNVMSEPEPCDVLPVNDQSDNDNYLLQRLDSGVDGLDPVMAEDEGWTPWNSWPLNLQEGGTIPPLFSAGPEQENADVVWGSAPDFVHSMSDFSQTALELAQSEPTFEQSAPDFDLFTLGGFPFLSNFTKASGFTSSFECGTLVERQIIAKDFRDRRPRCTSHVVHTSSAARNISAGFDADRNLPTVDRDTGWESLPLDSISLLFAQPQCPLQPVDSSRSASNFQSEAEMLYGAVENDMFWSMDELAPKTYEIVESIKDITCNKPRGSAIAINWSLLLEKMCLDFFSPQNIRKHLALFWSCWYPNCPVIHRPTFDATRVSHLLLASMVLLGACLSPDNLDCAGAKIWFNSLEETIFSCGQLYDKLDADVTNPSLETPAVQEGLQLLQAAYFISLVQNWEGSQESKRRIRRHRYSTIIAFVRDFGISNATLKDVSANDICTFKWEKFIVHESLIRTFIYVFLFDSAFVIFNNSPPRMVVPEWTMDLACPESCFQASSSEECFVHLNSWNSGQNSQQRPNMSSTIKIMCYEQVSAEHQSLFCSLSTLNMFAIATGLHYLAFQIKSSLVSASALSPIHVGIANWKHSWLANPREELINQSFDLPRTMWKRIGFIRHAPEFWLLVKVIIDRFSIPQQGMAMGEALYPTQEIESHSGLPTKYDHADMSQLNALITTLQAFGLSP